MVLKNAKLIAESLKSLMKYTKANGVELEGLKIRRQKEGELWECENDGIMEFKCLISSFLKKAPGLEIVIFPAKEDKVLRPASRCRS